jgi:hypothetical protein
MVPPPFQAVIVVSLLLTIVLLAVRSQWWVAAALPLVAYVIVILRQAKRLRHAALEDLATAAPSLPADEVERRLAAILEVYGGRHLPSVRRDAERIRARGDV